MTATDDAAATDAAAAAYIGDEVVTDEVKELFARQNGLQTIRGLGIALVVVHHMTGGLTNAASVFDAFFVISGYLISIRLIVLARTASVRDYFVTFYTFRARRILPVALLTLLATAVVAHVIYLPSRAHQADVDVAWASLFLANVHFAQTGTDYFQQGGVISPVLNFWSLSVEEQFYLVWPLVILIALWVANRRGRGTGVTPVALVIIVLSFLYGWHTSVHHPVTAYYSTLARVWDFGIGARMASFAVGQARRPGTLAGAPTDEHGAGSRPVPLIVRINRALVPRAGLIAWCGVVLVILAMAYTPASLPFPVPAAAFGMVGMGIVFYSNTLKRDPLWLFAHARPLIWLGDISYSLYVVHLPVVVFASSYITGDRTMLYAFDVAASLALATLLYHFVELPARQPWTRTVAWFTAGRYQPVLMQIAVFGMAAGVLMTGATHRSSTLEAGQSAVGTAGGAAGGQAQSGFPDVVDDEDLVPRDIMRAAKRLPQRFADPNEVQPEAQLAQAIAAGASSTAWPTLTNEGRVAHTDFAKACDVVDAAEPPCIAKPAAGIDPRKVAVGIGDSTMLSYWPMLRDALVPRGWTVVMYGLGSCPAAGVATANPAASVGDCVKHHDSYTAMLARWRPALVLASDVEASPYMVSDGTLGGRLNRRSSRGAYEAALTSTVRQAQHVGAQVVLLSPPPVRWPMATCAVAGSSPQDCVSPVSGLYPVLNGVDRRVSAATGARYADLLPYFCEALRCPGVVGDVVVAADFVHLTPEYAAMLAPSFQQYLLRAGLVA